MIKAVVSKFNLYKEKRNDTGSPYDWMKQRASRQRDLMTERLLQKGGVKEGVGGEARTNEEVSVSAAAEKCIQRCIGDAVAKAVTNRRLLRFKNNSLLETKRLSICPCQRRHVSMYGSRN